MRIRITKSKQGFGDVGDELEVSAERATRWRDMGIAEFLDEFLDEDPEPEPQPKRRGRPPKEK